MSVCANAACDNDVEQPKRGRIKEFCSRQCQLACLRGSAPQRPRSSHPTRQEGPTIRVSVTLPADVYEQLADAADRIVCSVPRFIEIAITNALSRRK